MQLAAASVVSVEGVGSLVEVLQEDVGSVRGGLIVEHLVDLVQLLLEGRAHHIRILH